jgi:hypothetical protein
MLLIIGIQYYTVLITSSNLHQNLTPVHLPTYQKDKRSKEQILVIKFNF